MEEALGFLWQGMLDLLDFDVGNRWFMNICVIQVKKDMVDFCLLYPFYLC